MRKNILLALGIGLAASAHGQIASDVATDPTYVVGQEYIQVGTAAGDQTGATNGKNGGFGFNPWQRGGYSDGGTGVPPYGTTLITNLSTSFNMGAQQFNVRSASDGTGGADARRRLLNPMTVGQTFSASIMEGGNGAGQAITTGSYGVVFRSGLLSNPGRDMLSVDGGGAFWTVSDRNGTTTTTIPVTPGLRLDLGVRMTGGDNFSLTLNPFGGSTYTDSGVFISTGQALQTAQFYAFHTNGDFYMNNLRVVPEPATMLGLGLGVCALAVCRRRK